VKKIKNTSLSRVSNTDSKKSYREIWNVGLVYKKKTHMVFKDVDSTLDRRGGEKSNL